MHAKLFLNLPFAAFILAKLNILTAIVFIFSNSLENARICMFFAGLFLFASVSFSLWDMLKNKKNEHDEYIKKLIANGNLEEYILKIKKDL